jgi:hypothetical protein
MTSDDCSVGARALSLVDRDRAPACSCLAWFSRTQDRWVGVGDDGCVKGETMVDQ